MQYLWRSVSEMQPGPKWAGLFHEFWPDYNKWWIREGADARPTYWQCLQALKLHMPELLPLYEQLCSLAGGGDHAARFLSFYGPPPYLSACSQAIWPGQEPVLVRNYDYSPLAFDRLIIVGDGFGVPLILRYVLQVCETAGQAAKVLARVPSHMSYNVTVIDAERNYITAFMAPDRPAQITHAAVATNHQDKVEWAAHARFTATVERERYLLQRLSLHVDTEEKFISAFLKPPLYSSAFADGFGTLYTAVYRPRLQQMELRWPRGTWHLNMETFVEDQRIIHVPATAVNVM